MRLVFMEINHIVENSDLMQKFFNFLPDTLKYWVGFQWVSLTLWEEGASLSFVGHCSSGPVTIKIPYGVVFLFHRALF